MRERDFLARDCTARRCSISRDHVPVARSQQSLLHTHEVLSQRVRPSDLTKFARLALKPSPCLRGPSHQHDTDDAGGVSKAGATAQAGARSSIAAACKSFRRRNVHVPHAQQLCIPSFTGPAHIPEFHRRAGRTSYGQIHHWPGGGWQQCPGPIFRDRAFAPLPHFPGLQPVLSQSYDTSSADSFNPGPSGRQAGGVGVEEGASQHSLPAAVLRSFRWGAQVLPRQRPLL